MSKYVVRDPYRKDVIVTDADNPADAAQNFIDAAKRKYPDRYFAPTTFDIYRVDREDRLTDPIDKSDL